jgi:hypothetical protein
LVWAECDNMDCCNDTVCRLTFRCEKVRNSATLTKL